MLAGLKGSGKNTVANFLEERLKANGHRVKQFALADELRRLMGILNPIVGRTYDTHSIYGEIPETTKPYRYNDAISDLTYDVAKVEFPEIRRLLQTFGSDLARDQIDDNIWVDMLQKQLHQWSNEGSWSPEKEDVAIITDVRFPNESYGMCEFAADVGGEVYGMLVTRPGLVSDGHQSEQPEKAFSHPLLSDDGYWIHEYDIENNGTLDELRKYCYDLADEDLA